MAAQLTDHEVGAEGSFLSTKSKAFSKDHPILDPQISDHRYRIIDIGSFSKIVKIVRVSLPVQTICVKKQVILPYVYFELFRLNFSNTFLGKNERNSRKRRGSFRRDLFR